ncbi:MAG: LEA type 2 family protein [Gammaproteobacteria bacterium]|jgi:LEA14-like dessication related protein|nr:LEA type 2 family protein [Gammaproteobacteria bacterium]
MAWPRVLLIFALTTVLAGCAWIWRSTAPPTVHLTDVRAAEMGAIEQRYTLRLRVQNPNPRALEVRGMRYEVEVNERPFARGVSPQAFTVPAYGETQVEVDVLSNAFRLYKQLKALESGRGEPLRYRLVGEVDLGGWSGALRFEDRGEVGLPVRGRTGGGS